MPDYEFIIIGSGAGGGTIAHQLALAGKKILILERGDFVPVERQNWDAKAVFEDGRYVSKDTWYDGNGKAFQPQAHYNVGGATKFYGAALFRLRPSDFGERQFSSGTSPAWPVSYADMEPWYSRAESLYQVHGHHGDDPTEGPWSAQYPYPPVSHSRRIQQISDDLTAAGYHPFHAPSAVLLDETPGSNPFRSTLPCVKCSTCDGFPCMMQAKADAETIALKPILNLPNVTLMTNAEVIALSQETGRVSGVLVLHDNDVATYTAETVILAAGAVNTAKILLQSGIANSSGQVGRNYMAHNSRAVIAVSDKPNNTVFQKTLAVNHFYRTWGSIQMVGKSSAAAMKGEDKLAALFPDWTLEKIARHAVDFWLMTEDLPLPENRVTLASGGDVQLTYRETNKWESDRLYAGLKYMLNHAGTAEYRFFERELFASMKVGLAGVAHQAGTCVMGNDPRTSVLDVNCKAHDIDNLYVVDASFMPSVGAVNPALTIIANALRVADHLLSE
jgi:choline dehydrogenase-like flavoprotein